MKNLFFVTLFLPLSLLSAQETQADEQSYAQALEYVYGGQYAAAQPLLESLIQRTPNGQIAETLAKVYAGLLWADSRGGKTTPGLQELIKSNLTSMMERIPGEGLFRESVLAAYLLKDEGLMMDLSRLYLKSDPESITANSVAALINTQQPQVSPQDIIRFNAKVARAEPSTADEEQRVAQARQLMARAFEIQGDSRRMLRHLRLAAMLSPAVASDLLRAELRFLNFPYALQAFGRIEALGGSLSKNSREVLLGTLLAEGSAESLRSMDALLSASPALGAYEEALSLYRRGITPRALASLEAVTNLQIRQRYSWFYLDLRHRLLKRIGDTNGLILTATSLGGQAYLAGKFSLALHYLADVPENERGELSYLLGMIYQSLQNRPDAERQFLRHLDIPEAVFKAEALSGLLEMALQARDIEAAHKYMALYEASEGYDASKAVFARGKIATIQGNYGEAKKIFGEAFQDTLGEKAQLLMAYHISSLFLEEWLQSSENKQILLDMSRLYIDKAFQIVQKQPVQGGLEGSIYNLYAYANVLAGSVSEGVLEAAALAAENSPQIEMLDTAAVAFIEAGRPEADAYFTAVEREAALLDLEQGYIKNTAPPYIEENSAKDPRYYEIYAHLAAWHAARGRRDLAQKYAKEALGLALNRAAARRQIQEFYSRWRGKTPAQ